MRLQGAIFDFDGTLLDKDGQPLPGVDRFLFLMKLEDVWMYVAADQSEADTRQKLEQAGLWKYFRGVMAACEHRYQPTDPDFYLHIVRRLRTAPKATTVFTARPEVLRPLSEAGATVVLVGPDHPEELHALASETIFDYRSMVELP